LFDADHLPCCYRRVHEPAEAQDGNEMLVRIGHDNRRIRGDESTELTPVTVTGRCALVVIVGSALAYRKVCAVGADASFLELLADSVVLAVFGIAAEQVFIAFWADAIVLKAAATVIRTRQHGTSNATGSAYAGRASGAGAAPGSSGSAYAGRASGAGAAPGSCGSPYAGRAAGAGAAPGARIPGLAVSASDQNQRG
jgi:hypothetical protein